MGSLSVSTCRGRVPWQGLLLAVSLVAFWSPPATAQLAIASVNAAEGKDVRMRLRNMPPDYNGIVWYRGDRASSDRSIASFLKSQRMYINGPTNSGLEKVIYDGSLLIKKVTVRDTGMFTVVIYLRGSRKEIGFGRLNVYRPVRVPTILASNTTVTENKGAVVLTCHTDAVSIEWLFYGLDLQLSERMKLSQDRRSLTIDPVRREDAGNYQCKASNPISSAESWPLHLDVKFE